MRVEKTTRWGAFWSALLTIYHSGYHIEMNEMGGACGTYMEGLGGETWGKEPLGRPTSRWDYNIKADLQEVRLWNMNYTWYTQKNGAVSKVNKKFISYLARAQRTPSAAATVQVSHAPGRCFLSKPCTKLTLHCNQRSGHLKTEHTESLSLLRRHLGNRPRGPAVSMRSVLLVAHEKLGQLLLLTVYVVPA